MRESRKAKITSSFIKSITYENVDSEKGQTTKQIWWDTELAGFGVRVYPTGKKSFVISYRHNRRKRIKVIGSCDLLTVTQARDKARRDLVGLLDGIDPLENRDSMRGAMLFSEFAEMYLERYSRPHNKGWKSDESRIRVHLLPRFGKMAVDSITADDVQRMHLEIGYEKGNPGNANRIRRMLSSMFTKAAEWGVVPEGRKNPAKGKKHGSRGSGIEDFPERERDRYVNKEELPVLIAAIDEEDIYARSAIWLYLLTAFRKSELLTAKWDQIDMEQGQFILPDPKNNQPLYHPLSEEAKAILSGIPRMAGNPYIFCGRTQGRPLSDIKSHWARVRERTGFDDLRIHDLRRTMGSWLVQAGNSLYLVGKILNHKDIRTTERYARFAQDNLKTALDQVGAQMVGIAGKSEPAEVIPLKKSSQ
ncbi:MAG: tyrosine-type recombinase/integrase [Thiolinea sp.]